MTINPTLATAWTLALLVAAATPGSAGEPAAPLRTASAEPALPAGETSATPVAAAPPAVPALATPGQVGALREGAGAYRRGDVAAGDRVRTATADPAVAAVLDWAAVRYGGAAIPFERIEAFTRENPAWPRAAWLRRRAEEELLRDRKPAETVRAFFAREKPVSASGRLALALAFRADGLGADAADLAREAWRADALSRDLEARFLDAFADVLQPADHRARMERLLFRENWDGARRAAEMAGKGYDALVRARVAVVGKAANAARLLDAVPAALRADTSYLYSRAQFLRRAEKAGEAAALMDRMSRDPAVLADGDEWWMERRILARKLLDAGDPKTAYAVIAGHGAVSAERRIEAEFFAGFVALRQLRDPALAGLHFARASAVAATPISLSRVAYWQGRAAEAGGQPDEARVFYEAAAEHPVTYYGQLGAAKLGRAPAAPSRLAAAPPVERAAAASPAVRGVGLLYAAGLRDLAVALSNDLARAGDSVAELDAAAALVLAQNDAPALLSLGKAATQRGLPLFDAAFPTIGIPAFEPVGANRVEPAMVYAIARQESAFEAAAQSPVGARGLMQMMPATAQATARKAGVEWNLPRLTDATYNAQLGAAHLGDLMEDWRGSHILTFASYNAGPGNARKWVEAYGDPRDPAVDAVDWVERIPFAETRNYVQRVLENLTVYRRRLADRSVALADPAETGTVRASP